jgi:phosphatidylglycerophosphate synthase
MRLRPEQLPLVSSIEETASKWPEMSPKQKLGASAASLVTIAGPVARLVVESGKAKDTPLDFKQLAAGIAIDLRDGLDGKIARATNGVTPLGKELDPLADKIDFFIQEWFQYKRGDLPAIHLALRVSRDALVTALRSHVMDISDGEANVAAAWYGKASTAVRQASLRSTGLPFERDIPHLRASHQLAATGLLLYSGAKNVIGLMDERQKYIEKSD